MSNISHLIGSLCPDGPYRVVVRDHSKASLLALCAQSATFPIELAAYDDRDGYTTVSLVDALHWREWLETLLECDSEDGLDPASLVVIVPDPYVPQQIIALRSFEPAFLALLAQIEQCYVAHAASETLVQQAERVLDDWLQAASAARENSAQWLDALEAAPQCEAVETAQQAERARELKEVAPSSQQCGKSPSKGENGVAVHHWTLARRCG